MSLHTLWNLLFALWILSEILLALRTRTARATGNTHDRGSLLLLWIAIAASISAAGWSPAYLPAANLHRTAWLVPLAILLLLAGLTVRWVAILSLGRAFSVNVAIRPDQQIYQRGLYRFVRHPSYLGLVLIFLGVGLHTRNLVGLAIVLIGTTAALLYRIRVEEAALHQAFGAVYADYARSTHRLIPGVF